MIELALGARMTKAKRIEKIKEILKTDFDQDFLSGLKSKEFETQVACIRDTLDAIGG
jgi:hypothetical protein